MLNFCGMKLLYSDRVAFVYGSVSIGKCMNTWLDVQLYSLAQNDVECLSTIRIWHYFHVHADNPDNIMKRKIPRCISDRQRWWAILDSCVLHQWHIQDLYYRELHCRFWCYRSCVRAVPTARCRVMDRQTCVLLSSYCWQNNGMTGTLPVSYYHHIVDRTMVWPSRYSLSISLELEFTFAQVKF